MTTLPLLASVPPDALEALAKVSVEDVLLPVLVQLALLIVVARIFSSLFRQIGQPSVVGEIAAGLVLGPSLLGRLEVVHNIFHPEIHGIPLALSESVFHWIFMVLSQLGLIFLLFLVGLEFDFSHLGKQARSALAISISGVVLPFALGLAIAPVLLASPELGTHPASPTSPLPPLGFTLFLGTALSITALPVLARIMVELGITRSRLGALTITGAACNDATGWILLAVVTTIVQAQFDLLQTLWLIAATVGFALAMILLAKPLLQRWVRSVLPANGDLGQNVLATLLVVLMLCAITTNLIGIFAIFGAFFLGAILSGEHKFREAVTGRLSQFVTTFFLPIFFTYTGLRTNIDTLGSLELWGLCGLVLAAAIVGKFGGCGLAAWGSGCSGREAACVGALMNTRGLMELIVINAGYELRVIPPSVFCMLVLMALLTTVMTTPILLRLMWGTELEAYMVRSGFVAARPAESKS
jgi:Kef-type K+ transport system membrane component KefB